MKTLYGITKRWIETHCNLIVKVFFLSPYCDLSSQRKHEARVTPLDMSFAWQKFRFPCEMRMLRYVIVMWGSVSLP
ncbi:hypothetical protein K450DRAFT_228818 [Umbelopsis ramanniana AG]|uniref:Uncharacterized protein n=1 Tax=Umbelopsis ramanniana AG TaxID=1314678 RepID=A0AAD5EEU8_UMBRA|nr:uncharacterized protein K450DRAFT_228818 [Umbelopsis ramanniana AG]KAI8582057.1 hypothetical protein K450DRAFT_228818 [Umbelopsis ramanniana AG]